jgi:predicted nucleic acid-binding protein
MKPLLLDTCILIDFLRHYPPAASFMNRLVTRPFLSVVTIAEIHAGTRSEQERARVDDLIGVMNSVDVDAVVARRGGSLRRMFRDTHGTGLLDALIAATAEAHGARLVTRNIRHFPMLDDVLVPY